MTFTNLITILVALAILLLAFTVLGLIIWRFVKEFRDTKKVIVQLLEQA